MAHSKRFFTMYLTTTISVALVLFLVGMECVLMLSSQQLVRDLKENITLSVLISARADSTQIKQLGQFLQTAPYCHQLEYISKEQALNEHIASMGEDPQKFLGYNPLSNSYEVSLNAAYAVEDSIQWIVDELNAMPVVSAVFHPDKVVSALDLRLGKFSMVLVAVALVLLLISMVLIINTVRLHVYSKRFIINTMRLVGATSYVIRAPFIHRNLRLGMEAGLMAVLGIAIAVYVMQCRLGLTLLPITWQNALIVAGTVIVVGELVTLLAALIATSKYIRMKTDKMYEI